MFCVCIQVNKFSAYVDFKEVCTVTAATFPSCRWYELGHKILLNPSCGTHAYRMTNIHTLQLNFLFSDWLFSKYAECIENVHCTLRTAPRLRPDCAKCSWCVIARKCSHRLIHFFHWVKLLIFFLFSGILKPFYLQFFTNMSKWFCFSVMYELG